MNRVERRVDGPRRAPCAWACAVLLAVVNAAHAVQPDCCADPVAVAVADAAPVDTPRAPEPPVRQRAGDTPPAAAPGHEVFWPWWLGALALGSLTIAFWRVLGMPLGVSNSWDKVSVWRRERARERQESKVASSDPDRIHDALLAETLAQFGPDALEQMASAPASPVEPRRAGRRAPVTAHLTFLVMIGIGGCVSAMLNGGFDVRFDLGPVHREFFGDGGAMWLALFFGGALAGFGTRLGGGCTSGHGLSGMSCLQVGSIVATLCFFSTAILVSLLIEVFP